MASVASINSSSTPVVDFDVSRPWALSREVSLRDESFGALAYHHRTRRLVFLKSLELVTLVRALAEYDSVDDALDAHIDPAEHSRYRDALATLERSDILRER